MNYHDKKCKDCEHWHRQRKASLLVREESQGECRESPPVVTAIPQPDGVVAGISLYPLIKESWDACSQFRDRKVIE